MLDKIANRLHNHFLVLLLPILHLVKLFDIPLCLLIINGVTRATSLLFSFTLGALLLLLGRSEDFFFHNITYLFALLLSGKETYTANQCFE